MPLKAYGRHIGIDAEDIHKKDWAAEKKAIDDYKAAIKAAQDLGDNGSKELFDSILVDEEAHIDGYSDLSWPPDVKNGL